MLDMAEEFVEVYRTESPIVSQKVLDLVLGPEGIEGVVHDRKEAMFVGVGKPGGYFIAVPKEQQARAAELIAEAEQNGFLDAGEGNAVQPD